MIVRDARSSNVLVQTQGNIALHVERDPSRLSLGLQFGRLRSGLAWAAFMVGLIGITMAVQAPNNDPIQSELRLTSRIQNMEHLLNGIALASTAQAARAEILQDTATRIGTQVNDLPNTFDVSIQRSTSSLAGAISELQLKPTFPMVYADPALGFESDPKPIASVGPAAKPAASRPTPVRRRLAADQPPRPIRRTTSRQGASAPGGSQDLPEVAQ